MRLPSPVGARFAESGDPFVVDLEKFQGPLDLLLHLIRSQDIDIFDIPIAEITAQFIAAIQGVESRLSLERAGEFLEMAATLVRIKAQLLLPQHEGSLEDEDPRSDLVRRLLEYEFFREAAFALGEAEADRAMHHGKGYIEPRTPHPTSDLPLELDMEQFIQAALGLPEPPARRPHRAPVRPVTVDEKVSLWLELLKNKARVPFQWFIQRWKTRMHAVMSFLACLELAKRGRVQLRQESPFATLWVFSREDDENS